MIIDNTAKEQKKSRMNEIMRSRSRFNGHLQSAWISHWSHKGMKVSSEIHGDRCSCIFSSFHELMQSCGVRRLSVSLSVCLSVNFCANRFFYHINGWIATKLAHNGPQKSPNPGCAQDQGQSQRSRDTDTCDFTKIASSCMQMAGSLPNLHMMVPSVARIQDVLKVKVEVKGHVIRPLLWFHENRFFLQAKGWNATKLAHDGSQPGLHPGCAQGLGRGQRSRDTGTSVMSRNVCYTVRSHVLSIHALTLWSTIIILSFQYKYQTARYNV